MRSRPAYLLDLVNLKRISRSRLEDALNASYPAVLDFCDRNPNIFTRSQLASAIIEALPQVLLVGVPELLCRARTSSQTLQTQLTTTANVDLLANGEVVATLGLMASCELLPNLGEINVDIHKLMLHLDAQDDRNCEIKLAIADNRLRSGLTDANTFYKSKGNIRIDKFICE